MSDLLYIFGTGWSAGITVASKEIFSCSSLDNIQRRQLTVVRGLNCQLGIVVFLVIATRTHKYVD